MTRVLGPLDRFRHPVCFPVSTTVIVFDIGPIMRGEHMMTPGTSLCSLSDCRFVRSTVLYCTVRHPDRPCQKSYVYEMNRRTTGWNDSVSYTRLIPYAVVPRKNKGMLPPLSPPRDNAIERSVQATIEFLPRVSSADDSGEQLTVPGQGVREKRGSAHSIFMLRLSRTWESM